MKHILAVVATISLLFGATATVHALAYFDFSNPTQVNLLEKWNYNGTYGFTTTQTHDDVVDTQRYNDVGTSGSWRFGAGAGPVTARFTFDQPYTIDTLRIYWRNAAESPFNYTWSDQNGVIVSNNYYPGTAGASTPTTDVFAPRTSTYIQLTSTTNILGAVTGNGTWDAPKIAAFLAAGQNLPIDGTYNIFYEENGAAGVGTGGGAGYAGVLTDHAWNYNNPQASAGSITWGQFSREYTFYGAALSHLSSAFALSNATVEVSSDGSSWTTVFGPTDFLGTGHMVFSSNPTGTWARLSWTASGSGGGREIGEFQLFGSAILPEPTTALLLALGGLLLWRKRKA